VTIPGPDDPAARAAALAAEFAAREDAEPLVRPRVAGEHILDQFLRAAQSQNHVHFPSLAIALGSLGGYACQVAARAGLEAGDPAYVGRRILTVETADGGLYFAGDALLWPLLERSFSLWSLVAAPAERLGVPLPDPEELLAHSAATVGGPEFGVPRYAPGQAADSLPIAWLPMWSRPLALLTEVAPNPQHWPIAYGIALQQLFDLVESKSPGRYDLGAMTGAVMDAAIAMSKVPGPGG
jgi:hypothetical protein